LEVFVIGLVISLKNKENGLDDFALETVEVFVRVEDILACVLEVG
jgi:hypothetical protein